MVVLLTILLWGVISLIILGTQLNASAKEAGAMRNQMAGLESALGRRLDEVEGEVRAAAKTQGET
jgi:hypothetical protein